MGWINDISDRFFGNSGGTLDIEEVGLNELREEKANIKATVRMKRDRHQDISKEREKLFEKIINTDDELLKKELAAEISAKEDEMAILHNEHKELMDALRVVDGLISIKRKKESLADKGLISEIRNMEKEDIIDTLRRADVRDMIRDEKWDQLNSILKGQLSPKESKSERVDEIIQQAEDIKHLQDEMGTKEAVKQALENRDRQKKEEREMNRV